MINNDAKSRSNRVSISSDLLDSFISFVRSNNIGYTFWKAFKFESKYYESRYVISKRNQSHFI